MNHTGKRARIQSGLTRAALKRQGRHKRHGKVFQDRAKAK